MHIPLRMIHTIWNEKCPFVDNISTLSDFSYNFNSINAKTMSLVKYMNGSLSNRKNVT